MADKKIFKTENIVTSTAGPSRSVLEELNLPPAMETFLHTWHKPLLGLLVVAVVVVLGFNFGKQFFAARENRASEQLAQAMQLADPVARQVALDEVVSRYRRTGAGIWSRIELAHLKRDAGNLGSAAAAYEELLGSLPKRDPRSPMLRLNLAQLLVEAGEYERAATHYRELAVTRGFEAWGLLGAGGLLARQGDAAAARDLYRQVMALENVPVLLLEQAELRLAN